MARSGGDLREIKLLLQAQALALCQHLLPGGRRSGNYWMAKNPTRHDRHEGSFWVWIAGPAAGGFKDAATGDKGDVIGLIQYVRGWDRKDYKSALDWARGWLGLAEMPKAKRRELTAQAEARREAEERADALALKEDRRRAMGTWLHCEPSLIGTPAEIYLAGRGIRIASLPRQPGALRFSPAQKHTESGQKFPAIVAAMVGTVGTRNEIAAIHRTFLAADGSGKAPVIPVRKIWPRTAGTGACVHLWRGETGLSHMKAAAQGLWDSLVIVEGIEDGLSVAVTCPDDRVWCAGTLSNMADIRLPECAGEVIVCADNDWGKPEAQKLFDKALAALARQGRRTVKLARSPVGKDVNDALRAGV
jgi:hypothetical protein